MVRAVPVLGSSAVIIAVSATTRWAASTGLPVPGRARPSRSTSAGSATRAATGFPPVDSSARADGV